MIKYYNDKKLLNSTFITFINKFCYKLCLIKKVSVNLVAISHYLVTGDNRILMGSCVLNAETGLIFI